MLHLVVTFDHYNQVLRKLIRSEEEGREVLPESTAIKVSNASLGSGI